MANLSTKRVKHHLIYQKNLMWTQKRDKYLDNDDKSKFLQGTTKVQMSKAQHNQTK